MLTHIVCWKYKPETTEEQKVKHLEMLRSLPGIISEVQSFAAGRDILHLDRSFNAGIVVTFADAEALETYSAHPEHVKVAAFGKEIALQAVSVDFTE
ncbi:MAG: Dabb family protein [Acidobacteria bacterium]|nr:Dabb family protein [Acidobacteriota bacterium]